MMIKKVDVQIKTLKSALLLTIFLIFTNLLMIVNVQPIGPDKTKVGFAVMNKFFLDKIGVHSVLYTATDKLAKISFLIIAIFAILGLVQLIKRKSIWKVDSRIIALGVFYIIMLLFYIIFDKIVINYRPVKIFLDDAETSMGVLQPSYPSSHTFFAICLYGSAMMEVKRLLSKYKTTTIIINIYLVIMIAFEVIGRTVSGVHWFTDIIGAILLSVFLLYFYNNIAMIIDLIKQKHNQKRLQK